MALMPMLELETKHSHSDQTASTSLLPEAGIIVAKSVRIRVSSDANPVSRPNLKCKCPSQPQIVGKWTGMIARGPSFIVPSSDDMYVYLLFGP